MANVETIHGTEISKGIYQFKDFILTHTPNDTAAMTFSWNQKFVDVLGKSYALKDTTEHVKELYVLAGVIIKYIESDIFFELHMTKCSDITVEAIELCVLLSDYVIDTMFSEFMEYVKLSLEYSHAKLDKNKLARINVLKYQFYKTLKYYDVVKRRGNLYYVLRAYYAKYSLEPGQTATPEILAAINYYNEHDRTQFYMAQDIKYVFWNQINAYSLQESV